MEEKIIIGKDTEYPLEGILTIPDRLSHKVPAVLLVHGSGPLDKDETIMAKKPFRDIAEYLSAAGIAVLRYDKRSKIYANELLRKQKNDGGITVREETIEDAILAANLLKNHNRIDPDKVFIIGHSLGGMLAPRIDAEGGNFAGIIILAGSPRTFREIILGQNKDSVKHLNKFLQIIAKRQISSVQKKLDSIPNMSDEEAKNEKALGNIHAWYFKEMEQHSSIDYLRKTQKPVLILQGDKDFQVTVQNDFAEYQRLLLDKTNISFKLYAGLNHLFSPSVYETIIDFKKEYKIPSKVDPTVLKDISVWILSN